MLLYSACVIHEHLNRPPWGKENMKCVIVTIVCTCAILSADTITTPIRQFGYGQLLRTVLSPGGRQYLTESIDGKVRLWDVESSRMLRQFSVPGICFDLQFSADESRILTIYYEGALWDLETGKKIPTFPGHKKAIETGVFSADGSMVLTGSMDRTARLWHAHTGEEIRAFTGHTGSIFSAAISPDNTLIITGSRDSTAILWDAKTAQKIASLTGHQTERVVVAFSPDGSRVVTGSGTTAHVWSAHGKLSHTFPDHDRDIRSVGFSPDGSAVITRGDYRTRFWNLATDTLSLSLNRGFLFTPDGSKYLSTVEPGHKEIWIFRSIDSFIKKIPSHGQEIKSVSFNANGELALVRFADGIIKIFNTRTDSQISELRDHAFLVRSAAFSTTESEVIIGSTEGHLSLRDIGSGSVICVFHNSTGRNDPITTVAMSPDGSKLFAGKNYWSDIWDVHTGKLLHSIRSICCCTGEIRKAVFSPDGLLVGAGAGMTGVMFWSTETGKDTLHLDDNQGALRSIQFSGDGSQVMTSAEYGTSKVWDLKQNRVVHTYSRKGRKTLFTMISPDRSTALVVRGNGKHYLYDVKTGRKNYLVTNSGWNEFNVSCFSSDSKLLAVGLGSGGVKVWDINGKEIREFHGYTSSIRSIIDVSFSSKQKQLLAVSQGGTAMVWDISDISTSTVNPVTVHRNMFGRIISRLLSLFRYLFSTTESWIFG